MTSSFLRLYEIHPGVVLNFRCWAPSQPAKSGLLGVGPAQESCVADSASQPGRGAAELNTTRCASVFSRLKRLVGELGSLLC